jgi:hypothetical protein
MLNECFWILYLNKIHSKLEIHGLKVYINHDVFVYVLENLIYKFL